MIVRDRSRHLSQAIFALAASAVAVGIHAATLTWDNDATLNATYGGTGTWDTNTTTNWSGASEVKWTDATGVDIAEFKGTAGTVTLSDTNTANGLVFGVTGYTLTGGTLNLAGTTPTISVTTAGQTANLNSTLAGSGFTKSGSGVLSVGGSNASYSGPISLAAGQLSVTTASGLGTGQISIGNGTTLAKGITADLALTTNNPQLWNGTFTFAAGGNDNQFNLGTGAVTLGSNVTVNLTSNGKGRFTIGGAISGGYSLTITGSGSAAQQLILAANNSYTGGTTLSSGGLTIANDYAIPAGTVTINGGGLNVPHGTTRSLGNNNPITLGGTLNYGGSGNALNADGTLNTGTGAITMTASRTISVTQGTLNVGGLIGDSGSNYALTYSGGRYASGVLSLNAANTFGGGVTIQTGGNATTLNLGNLAAPGTGTITISPAGGAGTITINNTSGANGTLTNNNPQVWDTNFTFGASGSSLNVGTGVVSLGTSAGTARTLTISGNTLTVGGVISNGATATGITKAGGGTLALAGVNTYSGLTTVSAGTLSLTGSLATGKITVAGGTLNGSGAINFNLGATPDVMTLTSGTLNLSGLTINFVGAASLSQYTLLNYSAGGTLTTATNALTGNTFFARTNLPSGYAIVNDTTNKLIVLNQIPEPASLSAAVLAGLGLLARRRRVS